MVVAAIVAMAPVAQATAQQIDVRVDSRVELIAALFRMAGRSEYNMTRLTAWGSAVDSHFVRWSGHPAAQFTRRLATTYGVGFFVPMNLAVHLSDPPALEQLEPLASASSLHRTWRTFPDSTRWYVEQLRSIAAQSGFADFMRLHARLIDTTEARLNDFIARRIDVTWFSRFWGERPTARFVLVPGLTNGRASYGVEYRPASGPPVLYSIVGVSTVDGDGLPTFPSSFVSTIVHEFNHAFANALVEEHRATLATFGDSLYATVAERMRRQAYGSWDSMLNETLVRAAVVRYLAEHEGAEAARAEIAAQVESGFLWMDALDLLLRDYEARRDVYPTVRSFMPRVVQLLREFAAR